MKITYFFGIALILLLGVFSYHMATDSIKTPAPEPELVSPSFDDHVVNARLQRLQKAESELSTTRLHIIDMEAGKVKSLAEYAAQCEDDVIKEYCRQLIAESHDRLRVLGIDPATLE